MFAIPEQFKTTNQTHVETFVTVANVAFASAERLAALNLSTTREFFEDGVANAKALLAAKDLQELASLQGAVAQPMLERAVAYSRNAFEIATRTHAELSKVAESQLAKVQENVAATLDEAAKSAPAGSDVAIAAAKSAIAAANSAYESMTKAAKQVYEIAEANVNAAGALAPKSPKKAA